MARNIALYGTARPIVGQSFKHVKRVVVPNQSMSLREILIRFTRREALPVEHEGEYLEGYGDLEKMARKDMFEQREHAELLKSQIAKGQKIIKDKAEAKAKADMEEALRIKLAEEAKLKTVSPS